jgi:ribosome-associated protein
MSPLVIHPDLTIPPTDLSFRAVRASGPGGQNVNKVSSKVELSFDLGATRALADATRERLRSLFPSRVGSDGRFRVTSQKTRDQLRNLDDACDKLRAMILSALATPKARRATRPSASVKRRRVAGKRRDGAKKALRGARPDVDG